MAKKTPRQPAARAPRANSAAALRRLQRAVAAAVREPLAAGGGLRRGTAAARAARLIKPNDRLDAFARLEVYNVQYWLRLLGSLRQDFPILEAVLGEAAFARLARAYLARHPSRSFTLRDLGSRLEAFLRREPRWAGKRARARLARDVARFEWAQVVAFDGAALPPIAAQALAATPPARLRLRLQPHLSLLRLAHPVDTLAAALQQRERLRATASQAMEPAARPARRTPALPALRPEPTRLAVHRIDGQLYAKRLEPAAFRFLAALDAGKTLGAACRTAFPPLPRARARQEAEVARRSALLREWFRLWGELGWLAAR